MNHLAKEFGAGDRQAQIDLADAYVQLGDLQGKPYEANIGDSSGARSSYEKALEILRRLRPSDDVNYQRSLAKAEENYAYLLIFRYEQNDNGLANIESAKQRREAIYAAHPQADFARRELAQTLCFIKD
ncbi:MAG: hypothetical protein ACR2GD_05365 [Pyrinomonadaceae bacterium]